MVIDHDLMENIILYHCLTDSSYLASVVDYIKPDYFRESSNQQIIQVISDFFDRNNTCPTITEVKTLLTTEELKRSFKKVVGSFENIDKNGSVDELTRNTEQFLREKAVFSTMLEAADLMDKGKADTSALLDKFERACNINLTTDFGTELYSNINKVIEDLERVDPVIPTKWEWFNKILDGGFLKNGRALYVIAGQPNVGKSLFLGNIANSISEYGYNVLTVSLEMSEMIYSRRLCSNITGIPLSELAASTSSLKYEIDELHKRQPERKLYVKEFPPSTITPKQLSGFVKKLIDAGVKIDAIVVDYMNLLHSTVGSNSYERVKHVAEQLRAMSYVYNCPVITATQLNRTGVDISNPGMDTLSESIGVAATADFIMGIWQDDEDKEMETIHAGIMKNRFGRAIGTTQFSIDYRTLILDEVSEDAVLNTSETSDIYNTIRELVSDS